MKASATGDEEQARRPLGNATLQKEACREMWTFAAIESWWQDARYALRALISSPGVTCAAAIVLALGIGVNTAVFTIVNSALSFDPGIERPEGVTIIAARDATRAVALDFRDLQKRVKSLESIAAYQFLHVNVSDKAALPERFVCVKMSATGFSIAGRPVLLGRFFQADDERPDAVPVVMLSHRVWQDRYGSDPAIIGKTIRVDEVPKVIIGVMRQGMRFPEDTDLWMPLATNDGLDGRSILFGRLAEGVQIAAARSELDAFTQRLETADPERFKGLAVDVRPILEIYGVYDARPMFVTVLCAVGFVY